MTLTNFSFVCDELAGSDAPYEIEDLKEFVRNGISHVFVLTPDLTAAEKLASKYKLPLEIIHLPVSFIPTQDQLDFFVSKMRELKKSGKKAVVHCQFGQERTGVFLAYYLAKAHALSISESIEKVRKVRPNSLKNSVSLRFLNSIQ